MELYAAVEKGDISLCTLFIYLISMLLLNTCFVLGSMHGFKHALVSKDEFSSLEMLLIQREKCTHGKFNNDK
jgi:hypothetical protein